MYLVRTHNLRSALLFSQSQDKATGGLNPEPCPICARPLGQEVSYVTVPIMTSLITSVHSPMDTSCVVEIQRQSIY